ncbi:Zinc finger protein 888 [Araneus ventricosus]|uniref:Zinc finger protein 888 n=1 Tax=Araneus ventricosus TaxID=182803 RepID=A0A4Y2GGR5_ARAVE|nr:Zinc finger protein 888 [Araneus ventricosus]
MWELLAKAEAENRLTPNRSTEITVQEKKQQGVTFPRAIFAWLKTSHEITWRPPNHPDVPLSNHNVSDIPLDESNALGTRYENGQNNMAMCENEKTGYNSDVSSISCDMCSKHFKSINYLRDHHFICMKDKQIEYTDCDKQFSNNGIFKIHMCKHLCLNGSPVKIHPNLISETNVHPNEKSDYFVSENHVEVVNVGCGGSVEGDDALLSKNEENDVSHEYGIVKSIMEGSDIQNSNIESVIDSTNPEKPFSDTSPVFEPSVSELVCDICNFKWPSNPDAHHHSHANGKPYSFSESDRQFSESLNGHLGICRRKKHDIHYGESRIVLLKQSNIIHNIIESAIKRSNIKSTEIENVCYSNEKSVGDSSSLTKSSVSEFACNICGQEFPSQSNLNRHRHTHTNYKLYNCSECGKQFSRIDNLKRHLRIHTRKNHEKREQYTCKVCLKTFAWRARLNFHLRIHTNAREFKCTLCGKGFNQNSTLVSHMLTHSGEKPHKCSICNKRFAMKNSLCRHLKRHSGDKPHQCDVCFHRFALFGDLKKHYRKHTGELPFECDICQKRFRRRSGLNAHIAAHTGNKPHKCDICQKKFFNKYALTSHRQVHTKDKIFVCNICDKSFKTNNGLKKHHQVHTDEKPFICSYCNKAFARKGSLDRHIWIHTGTNPYECKICKRLFNQKTSLQRHRVVHTKEKPYSCDICKKCFTQKSYLSTHKLTHSKEKS